MQCTFIESETCAMDGGRGHGGRGKGKKRRKNAAASANAGANAGANSGASTGGNAAGGAGGKKSGAAGKKGVAGTQPTGKAKVKAAPKAVEVLSAAKAAAKKKLVSLKGAKDKQHAAEGAASAAATPPAAVSSAATGGKKRDAKKKQQQQHGQQHGQQHEHQLQHREPGGGVSSASIVKEKATLAVKPSAPVEHAIKSTVVSLTGGKRARGKKRRASSIGSSDHESGTPTTAATAIVAEASSAEFHQAHHTLSQSTAQLNAHGFQKPATQVVASDSDKPAVSSEVTTRNGVMTPAPAHPVAKKKIRTKIDSVNSGSKVLNGNSLVEKPSNHDAPRLLPVSDESTSKSFVAASIASSTTVQATDETKAVPEDSAPAVTDLASKKATGIRSDGLTAQKVAASGPNAFLGKHAQPLDSLETPKSSVSHLLKAETQSIVKVSKVDADVQKVTHFEIDAGADGKASSNPDEEKENNNQRVDPKMLTVSREAKQESDTPPSVLQSSPKPPVRRMEPQRLAQAAVKAPMKLPPVKNPNPESNSAAPKQKRSSKFVAKTQFPKIEPRLEEAKSSSSLTTDAHANPPLLKPSAPTITSLSYVVPPRAPMRPNVELVIPPVAIPAVTGETGSGTSEADRGRVMSPATLAVRRIFSSELRDLQASQTQTATVFTAPIKQISSEPEAKLPNASKKRRREESSGDEEKPKSRSAVIPPPRPVPTKKAKGVGIVMDSHNYVAKLMKRDLTAEPMPQVQQQNILIRPPNAWGASFGYFGASAPKPSSTTPLSHSSPLAATKPLSSWFLSKGAANFVKRISFKRDHSSLKAPGSSRLKRRSSAISVTASGSATTATEVDSDNEFLMSLTANSAWRSWFLPPGQNPPTSLLDPIPASRLPRDLVEHAVGELAALDDTSDHEDTEADENVSKSSSEIEKLENEIRCRNLQFSCSICI